MSIILTELARITMDAEEKNFQGITVKTIKIITECRQSPTIQKNETQNSGSG